MEVDVASSLQKPQTVTGGPGRPLLSSERPGPDGGGGRAGVHLRSGLKFVRALFL